MTGPAAWLLAFALAVFALPTSLHACRQTDASCNAACCTSDNADASSCCAGDATSAVDIPVCCINTPDLPDATPLPVRDLAHPASGPAIATVSHPDLLAPPATTSRLCTTAPPAGHARRHAVLCLMLI